MFAFHAADPCSIPAHVTNGAPKHVLFINFSHISCLFALFCFYISIILVLMKVNPRGTRYHCCLWFVFICFLLIWEATFSCAHGLLLAMLGTICGCRGLNWGWLIWCNPVLFFLTLHCDLNLNFTANDKNYFPTVYQSFLYFH